MKTYHVKGMTCGHCVKSVKQAVEALPDVESATIDLKTGTLQVKGNVHESELRKAIDEAGYEMT